jgi:hypothetical protein
MTSPHLGRRLLPLVLLLLLVLALLVPVRHQRWARWFGDKVQFIVAPISHPLNATVRWLSGGRDTPPSDDAIRVLEEKLEETNAALLRQKTGEILQAEKGRLSPLAGQQPDHLWLSKALPHSISKPRHNGLRNPGWGVKPDPFRKGKAWQIRRPIIPLKRDALC